MKPTIMAHGGAWEWGDALDSGKKVGIEQALACGYAVLRNGGTAVDAVESTVISLEDNPAFDAGFGGYLNEDGVVQLDALIVDGAQTDFGAVAGATTVKNPISLARRVLEDTDQCFFVGAGADSVSSRLGLEPVANEELVSPKMRAYYEAARTDGPNDTVGAIAIDRDGNVASATSTSGTPRKPAGRVGDSPILGAGGYAQNGVGAAGATGQGEQIMRLMLSKVACDALAGGATAAEAASIAAGKFGEKFQNSMSGIIVIDSNGGIGSAQTAPKMAFGWISSDGNIRTATNASELSNATA